MKKNHFSGLGIPINVPQKVFLILKLTFLFLICLIDPLTASPDHQFTKITLDMKHTSMEEVISALKHQTGMSFFYSSKKIERFSDVSLHVVKEPLPQVLDKLLQNTPHTYSILDNVVVIREKEIYNEAEPPLVTTIKKSITGTIKDENGDAIPGVHVKVKGRNIGVITNIDGNYLLELPDSCKNEILLFSFVGLKSKEVRWNGQKRIDLILESDTQQIDEVVVTGYQKVDRKLFTGSAAKVKMEDIKLASDPDISKSLEGRVSGVQIQNVSSTFGAAPKIRIRGASSITGNQKPLWVIDGVVLEDAVEISMDQLNSGDVSTLISSGVAGLNMDDIESMQILKDVSATALYGARAMNGVIVISTKRGSTGDVKVNYSTNITIRPIPTYQDYNILNSKQQMSINRELYEKGWINIANTQFASSHGPYGKMFDYISQNKLTWAEDNGEMEHFLRKYETANTDWFKELFKTSVLQQHTLSLSGGGKRSTFYASLGYLHDNGWTIADGLDRYTALLKGSFQLTENFTLTTQANLSYREQQLSGISDEKTDATSGVGRYTGRIERQFDNNPFMYAMTTSRAIRAYDDQGELEFIRRNYADFNIIDELSKNIQKVNVRDMSFMTDLEYKIRPNLIATTKVSARFFHSTREREVNENSNEANAYRVGLRPTDREVVQSSNPFLYERPHSITGEKFSILPIGGILEGVNNIMSNYYFSGSLNWNPRITDLHTFTFLLGAEVRYIDREENWNNGFGHFFDYGHVSIPSKNYLEKLEIDGNSYFGKSMTYDRFAAYFFNYGYSYKGKYTINGTVRYDGSNRLGRSTTSRWLPTWNIGAKWMISEEESFKNYSWLNMLNIKASYGLNATLGNATNATDVIYALQTSRSFHPEASEMALFLSALENEELTWEKQYELNIGSEISVFNNRLSVEVNYYNRKGFDLIGLYYGDGVGGQMRKNGNIADMDSYGYEFSLNFTPIIHGNFRWNSSLNYSFHKSKITDIITTSWISRAVSLYGVPVLDGPVRGIYSTRFAGLDHRGIPTFYDRNNEKVHYLNLQSSDFSDLEYSGNLEPHTNVGFQNTFRWKGFSLSALITGQFGHKKRVMQNFSHFYTDDMALSTHMKNRWMVAGDEHRTDIPAILSTETMKDPKSSEYRTAYNLYGMSDRWLADAGFIRLKNVGLSYTLPPSTLQKLKLSSVNIGIQASNLAILWLADAEKLGGEDPEFVWSGGSTMPITRQYTVTFSIGF